MFDVKGLIEEMLKWLGLRGLSFTARSGAGAAFFLESAAVTLGGKLALGEFGQLSPALARMYDLRDPVFLAELNVDELLARRNDSRGFKALPQFPGIRRDIALLIPEAVTHEAVLNVVKQARPANLESVELFDIFRGKNVPPGQKSVAYAFHYRAADRTLTDADVNTAQEKLAEQLRQGLNATLREG